MNNPYLPFNHFVFRSPLFPFNSFIQDLEKISLSENNFINLLKSEILQEAIYLASPILFEEILRYLSKGLPNKKEEVRFKYSIVRYLCRMSTRCTPFGLFAGCSIGKIDEHTEISLKKIESYNRHTRLDMNYLCSLTQDISQSTTFKGNISFFSNTSIYKFGENLRYVEYFYNGTKRIHRIASVDHSEYLDKVLKEASLGKKINDLVELLTDDEISSDEASDFINELIDSQLLVSAIEPSVTGQEFLCQAIQQLQYIKDNIVDNEYINTTFNRLIKVNKLLEEIDKMPLGTTIEKYDEIIRALEDFKTKYDAKYLFQADMIKPVIKAGLKKDTIDEILNAIILLNKITASSGESPLTKFREAFYERYEEREMPLLQVLDNESGLGYNQSGSAGDINPLVDGLIIPQQPAKSINIPWNRLQSVLLKKYIEAKSARNFSIELTDKDFESFKPRWDDLPITISAMCRILKDDNNSKEILLKSVGGSSAATLLGRFCHADKQLEEHVRTIIKKEEEFDSEVIFAEIAHLPESRTGNILLRPVLRQYEIPYLAKPSVEKEQQLELSDLMVSVRNGRLILRSRRFNKEVFPRLSSAHNFRSNSMPVYHFLCDMQMQNGRVGVAFNWGALANEFNWLPRVKYKNIILSPARWTIKHEDVKLLLDKTDDKELLESVLMWRQTQLIPEYVVLDDGDNELFVNLGNILSIRTLFSAIKKRQSFFLEEFLFYPDSAVVRGDGGVFTNEFIISFYKDIQLQK